MILPLLPLPPSNGLFSHFLVHFFPSFLFFSHFTNYLSLSFYFLLVRLSPHRIALKGGSRRQITATIGSLVVLTPYFMASHHATLMSSTFLSQGVSRVAYLAQHETERRRRACCFFEENMQGPLAPFPPHRQAIRDRPLGFFPSIPTEPSKLGSWLRGPLQQFRPMRPIWKSISDKARH
jgi:hypothetical protein